MIPERKKRKKKNQIFKKVIPVFWENPGPAPFLRNARMYFDSDRIFNVYNWEKEQMEIMFSVKNVDVRLLKKYFESKQLLSDEVKKETKMRNFEVFTLVFLGFSGKKFNLSFS